MKRLLTLLLIAGTVALGAQQPSADPPKPAERTLQACEAELVTEKLAHLATKDALADSQAEGARAVAEAVDRGRTLVKQNIAADRAKLKPATP